MSGAIVQSAYAVDDSGATSTTISVTTGSGVTAGNTLVGFVGFGDGSGTTATASDGTAYTADAGGKIRNTTDLQSGQVFYLPNAGSGSHTLVVTFAVAVAFRRLRLIEVSGVQLASIEDKAIGAFQNGVGTGTDSISSTATGATTNANDFVLGFTQDTTSTDPGSGTMAAGTGYTRNGSNQILAVESKSVTATGTQTATFTDTKNSGRTTHVLALKELATASAPVIALPRRMRSASGALAISITPAFPPPLPSSSVTAVVTASDSVTFSDSANRNVSFVRAASDSVTFSDSANRNVSFVRAASDSVTFSDSANRSVSFVRAASDNVTFSDSAEGSIAGGPQIYTRDAVDAIFFSDSAKAVHNRPRKVGSGGGHEKKSGGSNRKQRELDLQVELEFILMLVSSGVLDDA